MIEDPRQLAGPQQVLDYVGRYTHRVAISNNRLLDVDDGHVRFRYKDYRAQDQQQTMTLDATEFIRRFLLHVLPSGFHRIRYDGLLGHRHRREHLAQCRHLLGTVALPERVGHAAISADYRDRYEALTGCSLRVCPRCHDGQMRVVQRLVGAPDRPRICDCVVMHLLRPAALTRAPVGRRGTGVPPPTVGPMTRRIPPACPCPSQPPTTVSPLADAVSPRRSTPLPRRSPIPIDMPSP